MLFQRRRVEEDLERIRRANLPPDQLAAEDAKRRQQEAVGRRNLEGMGPKDILAMVIAVFSLILPYALAFALLYYLFFRIFFGFAG